MFKKIYRELKYTWITALHILAMYCPNSHLKRKFYRLRGTRLGNHVDIASMVFLEDVYPELITIEDNVDIGPGVIIVTHDTSYHTVNPETPILTKKVIIKKNSFLGAGAIILPGVIVGEHSIVAAGAVVIKDVPPYTIVAGVPAKVIRTIDEIKDRFF